MNSLENVEVIVEEPPKLQPLPIEQEPVQQQVQQPKVDLPTYLIGILGSNNKIEKLAISTYPYPNKYDVVSFDGYTKLLNDVGYYIVKINKQNVESYLKSLAGQDNISTEFSYQEFKKSLLFSLGICVLYEIPSSQDIIILIPKVVTNKSKLLNFQEEIITKGLTDPYFLFLLTYTIINRNEFWDIAFENLNNQTNENIIINNLVFKLIDHNIKKMMNSQFQRGPRNTSPENFTPPPPMPTEEIQKITSRLINDLVTIPSKIESPCINGINMYTIDDIDSTNNLYCSIPTLSIEAPSASCPTITCPEPVCPEAACPEPDCPVCEEKSGSNILFYLCIVFLIFIILGLVTVLLLKNKNTDA
jgi:hypothetical protein